ncbi:MAG TPA: inositol monophosphatase family protein [Tepidisphaeraceae bacterium]|nr:inositol monophosphatase family protein [Tepidisphaeraceae bacterium]
MPDPSLHDLLSVATDAAYAAGRRTLAYFNTRVAVETKPDNTPVTRADREAEDLIRHAILSRFPAHSILGEEGGIHAGADPRYRWIIDPIDGTKSFICGVPMYGVLIGVEVNGRADVGVVYLPATDEMIAAAAGLGCRWNGRDARVSATTRIEDAVVCCTSIVTAMARSDAFEAITARARVTRGWGDCYGHVLVATGRADLMLDPRMNPWDCAPLLPIYREAGGHYTTWAGEPTIWGPDGVGTNAALHREVLAILGRETVKPRWTAKG